MAARTQPSRASVRVRVLLNPKRGLAIKVKTQPQPMSMETEPTIEEMTLRDYELSLVKKEFIQVRRLCLFASSRTLHVRQY